MPVSVSYGQTCDLWLASLAITLAKDLPLRTWWVKETWDYSGPLKASIPRRVLVLRHTRLSGFGNQSAGL